MRIVYVTEWSPYAETGVLKKILGQVEAWTASGHESRLFALVPTQPSAALFPAFDRVGEALGVIPQSWLDRLPWARLGYFNKMLTVRRARRAIERFNPDVIYYRQQGPWYPGLLHLFPRRIPLVAELNANESAETRLWGVGLSLLRRFTRTRLATRADGFVGVTREIATLYAHGPTATVGIPNAMTRPFAPLPPTGNTRPKFVFVGSAGVAGRNWHGLDLFLRLARTMPTFEFSIVGSTADDLGGAIVPENVRFLGPLYRSALEAVYRTHDVAISSLAIHRAGIREASPLKTREYLSYGLPVVVAYEEADPALHAVPYVLRIETEAAEIETHASTVAAFAIEWTNQRITADLSAIGSAAIEAKRLAFLADVVARSRKRTVTDAVH